MAKPRAAGQGTSPRAALKHEWSGQALGPWVDSVAITMDRPVGDVADLATSTGGHPRGWRDGSRHVKSTRSRRLAAPWPRRARGRRGSEDEPELGGSGTEAAKALGGEPGPEVRFAQEDDGAAGATDAHRIPERDGVAGQGVEQAGEQHQIVPAAHGVPIPGEGVRRLVAA